jgi:hypothetical protein
MGTFNVNYCIVCEDLREERFNKVSLLGFYGIAPDVNIKIKETGKTIDKLLFVLAIKGDKGTYPVKWYINNPNGTLNIERDVKLELAGGLNQLVAVIVIRSLEFKEEGQYTVQLKNSTKVFFESTFSVYTGEPSLFA